MKDHTQIAPATGCCSGTGSFLMIGAIALAVLAAGLWVAKQSGESVDLQMRRELAWQAVSIASAVNPENIRTLSFTADDKDRPAFRLLCNQLAAYADATGIVSLYTMALRDGQIVFGPESLPEGHPGASPPGTVYQQPSQKDFDIFETAQPQVQGPASDEYGIFVTASAPVVDRVTGDVLAVVGIDVTAREWKGAVRRAQWIPGGITLGLVAILFVSGLILRRRQHMPLANAIRLRHAESVLSLVFMSALTVALAFHFSQNDRINRRNTFYSIAQIRAETIVTRFNDMHLMLEQLCGFFESCEWVGEDEFSVYCRKILQFGSIQTCSWIPAVPDASADVFVQTVQAGGMPDFAIWQKNAEGSREPASGRPVYYPVLYLEPMRLKAALGYDEGSDPVLAAAIQQALNTGLSTASDPIMLSRSTNHRPAILIFKPVYAENQQGVVSFVIRPQKVLGGIRTDTAKDLDVCLSQLLPDREPLLLAGSSVTCGRECWQENESGLRLTVPVFRFGKVYALHLTPEAGWLAAHPLHSGRTAGWLGAIVTLLVSSLVGLVTNRRIKLEQVVARRTQELKDSEARFRSYFELPLTAIAITSPGKGWVEVNDSLCDLLGYSQQELRKMSWDQLTHPDDLNADLEQFNRVLAGEIQTYALEKRFIHKNGAAVWVKLSVGCVRDDPGEIKYFVALLQNITERKMAESRIRDLVNHLETVREDERKRLSRELHDDIGQIFTALKIDLMMVMDDCVCAGPVKNRMSDMKNLLSEGIQSVHSLCRRLRPGALDDLSLEDALDGLIGDWQTRNQVECKMTADLDDASLSDAVKTAVFRMVQESLTNVSRYAQASHVEICLVSDGSELHVSVADNGRGMTPGAAEKPASFGLLGMRERVESLGGTLHIESALGKGTRMEASFPLK